MSKPKDIPGLIERPEYLAAPTLSVKVAEDVRAITLYVVMSGRDDGELVQRLHRAIGEFLSH